MVAWAAAVVLLVIIVLASWKAFLVLAPVALLVAVVMRKVIRRDLAQERQKVAQDRTRTRLRADADAQHRAYMRGDLDKAMYGEFPAPEFVCDHKFCGGTCND